MQEKVRIENLIDANVDDLIYVCSQKRLSDPVHQEGVKLKKQWLLEMLDKYGSCAKIAYYADKPVAQILYYPEASEKTKSRGRDDVLVIHCIYNPACEAQKLGIGKRLLKNVIDDAKQHMSCLGIRACRFILAKAFDTREFLPMPKFYEKRGFHATSQENVLYLPVEGNYASLEPMGDYEPLQEDIRKAMVFYGPQCQFSYPFAVKIAELVKEVVPNLKIELINEWENPEASIKRKNQWLVVNAKAIKTFFFETEKFKQEVKLAAAQDT